MDFTANGLYRERTLPRKIIISAQRYILQSENKQTPIKELCFVECKCFVIIYYLMNKLLLFLYTPYEKVVKLEIWEMHFYNFKMVSVLLHLEASAPAFIK